MPTDRYLNKIVLNKMTREQFENLDFKNPDEFYAITDNTKTSGFDLFDTILKDHVLTYEESKGLALQGTYVYKDAIAGSRYGYPDFYNRCLAEKESSVATETMLGDSTITMYINGNGHKFYDIADKTVVDNWYNTYGIADFYGVDTANERIFLPRNDYFVQLTGDTSKVNNIVEAGLPNITGKAGASNGELNTTATGALYYGANETGGQNSNKQSTATLCLDASRSSSVYGNSDTVQPPSSLKLLYYCVGNTKVESAVSNVTEITTSENDTLPLFYNFYSKEDMTTTGAYVNASLGSWLSGNVYTTAYNELVNKLGTDNVKANTDTYTDYDFVVNQDDMTFRLPLSNGDNYGVGNLYYKVDNAVTNLELLDVAEVTAELNTCYKRNAGDNSDLSGLGMPSNKYIDLALGASGTSYTAPANGWFAMSATATGSVSPYVSFYNYNYTNTANSAYFGIKVTGEKTTEGTVLPIVFPFKKGQVLYATYANIVVKMFRFYYAEGEV